MGKQSKSRKQEYVGKGKVTPVQIAFIVDRYLAENNYSNARSAFRAEASCPISKSPVQEAPKNMLSLGAILDDYITLKEQKLFVDQERARLEHEKSRVQNFLKGMQDVMNAYNAASVVAPPPPLPLLPAAAALPGVPQSDLALMPPAGFYPMYSSPAILSTSRPSNAQTESTNFTTPMLNQVQPKRKASKDVSDTVSNAKRPRRNTQSKNTNFASGPSKGQENSVKDSGIQLYVPDVQGSNVVKCLFSQQSPSPPANTSIPKTPPLASSSQPEKSISPSEICSTATSSKEVTPQQVTSTNCTIISSETIMVSPVKQISIYTIEKNCCISTSSPAKTTNLNKKDNHVKGRLDFGGSDVPTIPENLSPGGSSTSGSDMDGDPLDLDFSKFDVGDFSQLLVDFDLAGDGVGFGSHQSVDSSPECYSGSPHTSPDVDLCSGQYMSHFSSTVTGILSEKDMNSVCPDSIASVKSVTKCIKIVSPVKNQSTILDQENVSARN